MSDYSSKLRDPRWQKKRLEIMERDGFKCVACGSGQNTLNVHHGYYKRGANPWSYPSRTLWTLCESCHEQTHRITTGLYAYLAAISPRLLLMAAHTNAPSECIDEYAAEALRRVVEAVQGSRCAGELIDAD